MAPGVIIYTTLVKYASYPSLEVVSPVSIPHMTASLLIAILVFNIVFTVLLLRLMIVRDNQARSRGRVRSQGPVTMKPTPPLYLLSQKEGCEHGQLFSECTCSAYYHGSSDRHQNFI